MKHRDPDGPGLKPPVDLGPLFQQPQAPPRWPLTREEEKKEAILNHLAALRVQYLVRLRADMASLYLRRLALHGHGAAYVSGNDAREVFEAYPDIPPPEELSRNFLATVFRTPDWAFTGEFVNSRVEGSHASRRMCYRLRE